MVNYEHTVVCHRREYKLGAVAEYSAHFPSFHTIVKSQLWPNRKWYGGEWTQMPTHTATIAKHQSFSIIIN